MISHPYLLHEIQQLVGIRLKTSVGLEGTKPAPFYLARMLTGVIALDLIYWNI